MTKKKEIWKDIEGYEGLYQVSNLGNVKRLHREQDYHVQGSDIPRTHHFQDMMLRVYRDYYAYPRVWLRKDGKNLLKSLPILVAKHFVPNPENLHNVVHKDYDVNNNAASNLKWVNATELRKHNQKLPGR